MRLVLFLVLPAAFLGALSFFVVAQFTHKNPLVLDEATASVEKNTQEIQSSLLTPTPPLTTASPTPTLVAKSSLPSSTPSVANYLLTAINSYRTSHALQPLVSDSHTCNFASLRVKEIAVTFNHDGFTNRVQGNTLPYPSFKDLSENIAMNGDYTQVVPNWINSSGHAENMRKDTPYGCVQQSGNFYVFESWKP